MLSFHPLFASFSRFFNFKIVWNHTGWRNLYRLTSLGAAADLYQFDVSCRMDHCKARTVYLFNFVALYVNIKRTGRGRDKFLERFSMRNVSLCFTISRIHEKIYRINSCHWKWKIPTRTNIAFVFRCCRTCPLTGTPSRTTISEGKPMQ